MDQKSLKSENNLKKNDAQSNHLNLKTRSKSMIKTTKTNSANIESP
jgi:hypothetical protein